MHPTLAPGERSSMTGTRPNSGKFPRAAIAFVVLCAVLEVVRSRFHILWADELGFGLLYLLRTGSFAHFIHLQLTTPVSFDPIGYNALVFAGQRVLGTSVFAMRLPDNCGYLGMQLCLFFIVRRIAGRRAATVALAIPAVLELSTYAILARPYGVLLGVSALAALSWQTAARYRPQRKLALVALALSLALAPNLQYFAVLVFVPICAAEVMRTISRRRIDVAMVAAIAVGMAGLLLVIPFAHALLPFRQNHVGIVEFDWRFITHSYLWLAALYVNIGRTVRVLSVILLVVVLGLSVLFYRRRRSIALDFPPAEIVLLALFAAFPALAYVVARFGTHWVDSRYTQPAIIGVASLLAIVMTPVLRSKAASGMIFALLFVGIAVSGVWHIVDAAQQRRANLESFAGDDPARAYLEGHPGQPILISDHTIYEWLRYYDAGTIGPRATLVVSPEKSHPLGVSSDVFTQMDNMLADGVANVVAYSDVSRPGMDQIFVLYHGPFEWTDTYLPRAHAQVRNVGHLAGGDLVVVHFP